MKTILFDFYDLNKYINAERTNRFKAAKIKKDLTEFFSWEFLREEPIKEPVKFKFTWFMKDKRKDPDNIAFQKKFILDGMKEAGIIENDSIKFITGFIDEFEIKGFEGVRIAYETKAT
jgi:Holliday junction resolvase RusA-like endonuclease